MINTHNNINTPQDVCATPYAHHICQMLVDGVLTVSGFTQRLKAARKNHTIQLSTDLVAAKEMSRFINPSLFRTKKKES